MTNLKLLGESVDKLITVDVSGRGVIHALYKAARQITGAPLGLSAAQALLDTIKPDDNVLITTGFPIPPTMAPETDGPLGALVLARFLSLEMGAKIILITEKDALDVTLVLAESLGMTVSRSEHYESELSLLSFPIVEKAALQYAIKTLKDFNPSAIIAVEKVGRNRRGVYHKMSGNDISANAIKVDNLFIEAEKRGVLTIGVGDGGNEIGMGQISEAVRKYVPYGEICECPCRGGIACEIKTDQLVAATVSNWGAYGIIACLSAVMGKTEGLHSGEMERVLLVEASRRGAVDGVTGKTAPSCDGLYDEVHAHLVELLRELTEHFI